MKLNIQLFADGKIVIGTEVDTSGAEEDLERLQKILDYQFRSEHRFDEFWEDTDTSKNKVEELTEEVKKLNKEVKNVGEISTKNLGKSLRGVVKNVTKWGLAIFGVRSAYMFIRQSISTLSQENKQLASDIQNIRYALASAIQPIVEVIIQLVYKLLGLLQNIYYMFTGENIFENANKGLKSSVGSAKQLKKILAGFDEMNIMQDTSSGGGAGGGTVAPSVDLSKIMDKEKADKMKKWWDDILKFWEGDLEETFSNIDKNFSNFWGAIGKGFEGFWKVVTGTVGVITNTFDIIMGLLTGDKEKVKKGFEGLIKNIAKIWDGIKDILLTPIRATIGLIKDIWVLAIKFVKDDIIKPLITAFSTLWSSTGDGASKVVDKIKNFFSSIPTFFSNIISKIKDFFVNLGNKAGDIIGNAFKNVINGVLKVAENVLNSPIKAINKLISKINDVSGISLSKLSTFSLPRLAKGGIINMPGRGVPIAYGGEKGQEGVIPLTDSQQMALLGEAIGKYITINANITNTMNGRVISRELHKIQNESNFANNL